MLIRFLIPVSSPHGTFAPGEEFTWPDKAEAEALIGADMAEPVKASDVPSVRKSA